MDVERVGERSDLPAGAPSAGAAGSDLAAENARLRAALQSARERADEVLEQQRATAEVLGAIKGSLGDAAPVLERIVESCGRLFAGRIVGLNRVDDADGMLRLGVYHGPGREDLQQIYPLPLEPTSGSAIAILEHRVVHYPDVEGDDVPPATKIGCRAIGIKSVLFAPLLWQARALGAIYVGRDLVRPFSEREIALLETFADQAAIAIQNGRLFNEVTRRNADLAEALAQQTATAEILHVISSSPSDVQPVFDAIAERAIALCNARIGGVARYDGELVHLVSFKAPQAADGILRRFPMKPSRASITARAIFEGKTVQVPDILEDPDYALTAESLAAGFRANLAVPMIRNGEVIGSIGVCREEPGLFPGKQVRLLQTFADQAVIAIENVRLFNETRDALERQTATAEILRVISSSPTSTIPVFESIASAARSLCHATTANVVTFDGTLLHLAARSIVRADGPDTAHEVFPRPIGEDTAAGRAILSGRIAMIPDVLEDALYAARHVAQARRSRSFLGVPLLRDGTPIGAIVVGRPEVGPFPDKQISLLQTFADQAVIAIENVRLFNETTEALEQQTATADILRVMSGSPTSTQPVFEAILESSARLCEADMGLVLRYENGAFQTIATLVPDPAFDEYLHQPIVAGPLTGLGRVARTKAAVHIPDLVDDIAYRERDPLRMRSVELGGVRTWLGMPMLRDGELIGVIAMYRKEVRPFEPRQIEVLRTFADQAVIAIENVRLFNATQEALETQTATTEVLRVISQSPTDVQPVFEAIAERAKVLCGAVISGVARYDGEWVHLVAYNGISAETDAAMRAAFPMRPGRRSILGWAVAQRAPVQIPDVLTDADYGLKAPAQEAGFRSNLAVPMIKDGEVIGAIGVGRPDAGLFPDRLVQLLQTFADQAVIAIENVRLFNELREKSEQLERASRHKSEFLANMSHELRTPLNAIIGFTRIVMRRSQEAIEAKQYENLEKILQSGQNLLALINSILDLAKVEAGRVEIHPGDVTLAPLLADCARTIEPLLDESAVKLLRDFDAAPTTLFIDEEKLRQIVVNLLSNAAKFTPTGTITIAAMQRDDGVTIEVRDTGIGIPADKLELVFEEFEQAGRSGADMQRGTGLGLTISRRLARLMGGDITATSTLGTGSTFTLTLPMRYSGPA